MIFSSEGTLSLYSKKMGGNAFYYLSNNFEMILELFWNTSELCLKQSRLKTLVVKK